MIVHIYSRSSSSLITTIEHGCEFRTTFHNLLTRDDYEIHRCQHLSKSTDDIQATADRGGQHERQAAQAQRETRRDKVQESSTIVETKSAFLTERAMLRLGDSKCWLCLFQMVNISATWLLARCQRHSKRLNFNSKSQLTSGPGTV